MNLDKIRSCNCGTCRSTSSAVKTIHKKIGTRKLRAQAKKLLRANSDESINISTGYRG